MDSVNNNPPIDHKAVNQWMLANGWEWVDDFSNLSKTVPGHWFKPEHRFVSQDLAAEMYRMADRRVEEAVAKRLEDLYHNQAFGKDCSFCAANSYTMLDAIRGDVTQVRINRATHHPKGGSNAG